MHMYARMLWSMVMIPMVLLMGTQLLTGIMEVKMVKEITVKMLGSKSYVTVSSLMREYAPEIGMWFVGMLIVSTAIFGIPALMFK